MTDHVEKTLKLFANHTQQKPSDVANVNQLAQKYVTVHLRMVPPAIVYPFIANDYMLTSVRTHTPPLKTYCESQMIDIPTYVYLMKHGFENRPMTEKEMLDQPSLAHFRDNMMPKPVGEEAWIDFERTDHWKKRALFLGLNFKEMPQFYDLVQSVYMDGKDAENRENKDALSDFYSKYKNFQPHKIDANELASIIKELDVSNNLMPQNKDIAVSAIVEAEVAVPESELTFGDFEKRQPIIFVAAPFLTGLEKTWEDVRSEPLVQEYRKKANLNVTFSPQKMVKQMILSSLAVPMQRVRQEASAILPHSTEMAALPPVSADAWPMLMSSLDLFDMKNHSLDPDAPLFAHLQMKGGETDARETLKTILSLYHPSVELALLEPRIKTNVMKTCPQMDTCIIKTIAAL